MKKKLFLVVLLVLIAFMMHAIFSQPGLDDFETNFKEITRVRNENNTGPVERVYLVAVDKLNQKEMEQYGKLMPYSKLGNTKVFFFYQSKDFPQEAQLGDVNFSSKFNEFCLAKYEKRFGYEVLILNPFR